jgi:alpha-1,2-mannosyltransferase
MGTNVVESTGRERNAGRAAAQVSALIVGPIFLAWMIWISVSTGQYLVDFQHSFLPAAHAVVLGASPYPGGGHLRELIARGTPLEVYVYPPLPAIAEAPLLLLPHAAALLIYSMLLAAALAGALWLMGVRDVRCYTAVCLWPAAFTVFQTGAVSAFLALGIALAWRWRWHAVRLGLLLAVLVAVKPFVWPLGLWLLVTGRYRATAWSIAAFPVLMLGGWAAIGFAGLAGYPHLLSAISAAEAPIGFGVGGVALAAHVPQTAALAAGLVVAAAAFGRLLAAPPAAADRVGLALAVFSMLLLSPVVWMHYLILLVVPTALASRRFSWLWIAPAVLQFAAIATMHGVYPDGNPLALGLCWASVLLTTAMACRTRTDSPSLGLRRVLLVGDVVAPRRRRALLVDLEHRQVGHEPVGGGAVPVLLPRLEEDAVAGP